MTKTSAKDAEAWIEYLSKSQIPVLYAVLKELRNVTDNDESSAAQLAEVILKDAALTSQVLKVANSIYFNPNADNSITTISRAVVQIGISGIKAICISVAVVDQLLGKNASEHLLSCMAKAFHAATQAQNMIRQISGKQDEEVFIAGLLFNLGEMAFWSTGGSAAEELDKRLSEEGDNTSKLQEEIIGTSFRRISYGLAEEWGLGTVLKQALKNSGTASPDVQAVILGDKLSTALMEGWHSPAFLKVLKKVASFCDIDENQAREMIMQSAFEAASIAVIHGANRLCHLIPSAADAVREGQEEEAAAQILKSDPQLQLNVLRELGALVGEKADINTLFRTVLEGMHRGIGLERVAIALMNPNRTALQAKYVLGQGTEDWREKFVFPVQPPHDGIFAGCVYKKRVVLVPTDQGFSPEEQALLGKGPAIMAPVAAGQKVIGVFYADRAGLVSKFDNDQPEAFKHFTLQANMCLALLAAK